MGNAILEKAPLGFPWVTVDPFLFCAHHKDAYPAGNSQLGPATSLAGRQLGQDFEGKDGWSMYHGKTVPGFPQHPHRGFETITLARSGYIDHSDSLGARARFGNGDVQWMTAGAGVVHSEMFPLVKEEEPNPTELFQIWLNLPAESKMVAPYFTMFWSKDVPIVEQRDSAGKLATVTVVAGALEGQRPPAPPPDSWASSTDADIAVWTIKLEEGGSWTLPKPKGERTTRVLYFFSGDELQVEGEAVVSHSALVVDTSRPLKLTAQRGAAELLLLQGTPIGEPVVHHGPFVMNTRQEIHQAIQDYQRTQFGGWPWPEDAPVHPRSEGRFAVHANGKAEQGQR